MGFLCLKLIILVFCVWVMLSLLVIWFIVKMCLVFINLVEVIINWLIGFVLNIVMVWFGLMLVRLVLK